MNPLAQAVRPRVQAAVVIALLIRHIPPRVTPSGPSACSRGRWVGGLSLGCRQAVSEFTRRFARLSPDNDPRPLTAEGTPRSRRFGRSQSLMNTASPRAAAAAAAAEGVSAVYSAPNLADPAPPPPPPAAAESAVATPLVGAGSTTLVTSVPAGHFVLRVTDDASHRASSSPPLVPPTHRLPLCRDQGLPVREAHSAARDEVLLRLRHCVR